MTTGSHPYQTESEGIHQVFNWVWADAAERAAETDFTALDINKFGLQQDDNSIWMLTAVTPIWVTMSGSGLIQSSSGADSIVIGDAIEAAGDGSIVAGGQNNEAAGNYSAVLGGLDGYAPGVGSAVIAGDTNEAAGDYSMASGSNALAHKYGQVAHSAGAFNQPGDSQWGDLHVRALVTHNSAAWFPLYLDGSALHATLPVDTSWTFDVLINGATVSLGKVFSFRIVGCIKNTAGTTALSGTPTVTTISDGDDVSFDARAVANDTDDSLDIEVSDSDGTGDVVQWTAVIRIVENSFPAP